MKGSRMVEESMFSEPILEPKPCENILRQGSKEGFKDGKGLRNGLRMVEESTVSEPILEPKPYKIILRQ
ncbi:hypothetical protein H5410_004008 [Solanum commersonii]|uniref:Uncharacterized protein n=1 Tax=Solanum commersonii TaxID=4109 RepID=A0A9J6B6Q5_SOLCO|nr:hypothetical protein H5410_004008 [Solanum commersonii]